MYYQQGDVILTRVDNVPSNAKVLPRSSRDIVLAEGEATGHAHVVTDVECEAYTLADALFIKCRKPVTVVHEEHKSVTIDSGIWQISIVREYDHFQEEARKVID